jgi:hypothetical protein
MHEFRSATSLDQALAAFGYTAERDEQGTITKIHLEDGNAKIGDERELFQALAPFVTAGSYLSFRGEEDEIFRWYFTGTTLEDQQGTISWE